MMKGGLRTKSRSKTGMTRTSSKGRKMAKAQSCRPFHIAQLDKEVTRRLYIRGV